MLRQAFIPFAVLATLTGCTTTLTNEKPAAGRQPAKPGFTYYLPKQRYSITATYELRACPSDQDQEILLISQSATITEAPVADASERYSVPIDSLTSGWKTTTLTGTLYDNQTLHTFGATADDRTGAVVKGIVGTVLSMARIDRGAVADATKKQLCHPEIYAALKVVREARLKLLDPALEEKPRAGWIAALTAAKALLQISQTYVFDPVATSTTFTGSAAPTKIATWFANPGLTSSSPNRQDYERILKTHARIKEPVQAPADLSADLVGHGIRYREPIPVTVQVCPGTKCADDSEIIASLDSHAAQFGRYAVIPLENGPFQKNNLSLSFATNGRLESFTYGTESRLEKAAGSVAESASSVETYLAKKKAADDAEAQAAAGAELKALKAETELIKAKADKIEAEARLRGLTGAE